MRAIRAHAELLLRDSAPGPDFAQRLGFLLDGARRVDFLVDAISSYSVALQITPASFQSTATDVMLRTALGRLQGEIIANQAEVTYDELPRVPGNPDRIIELLERLVHNALQHRGAHPPRIHVRAAEHAPGWLFTVSDNGPGVDAEYLERVFHPFERGPEQRAGAGMGLAICRVIVERHGGRIWAESAAGQGATFFFTLPADRPR